ncbi:spherulin-1B precursor [Roridomyces roridus]|uniref:Spherulin-1B n=1 Tax=Roridomyces roridus TaxID=1738132 RepID=A0AAD7FKK1_9AGAR|nr:spherulin-1B precursor [Roridomyces roridus]
MFAQSCVVLSLLALALTGHAAPASSASPPAVSASASASAPPTATSPGPVPLVSNGPSIAAGLKGQASGNDRLKKLLTDSSGNLLTGEALRQLTVFDFNQQTPAAGAKGGSTLLATVDNFPILTDLGISASITFLGPCGLNIPHSHPRATEFAIVTSGQIETGMVQENGFNTQIQTQLGPFQGTVFPQGSIHYQMNPTCSPAVLVGALGSEDPGRSDIVTNFWMLDADVIDAALGFPTTIGGDNIDDWRAHLPVNLAAGVDSCLQACGLSE